MTMHSAQLITPEPAAAIFRPRVAVVVPAFKQAALLPEALHSVAGQQADFGIVAILVNDGCPFPETHEICRDWALAYGERAVYLRKPNGGLSSARNAGIDYVLGNLPTVEAIYFLDSDNRLLPTALPRAFAELERYPEAAWIYPNIDMFGLQDAYDYAGEYLVIRHLHENLCEAGSLVHRRVFEAGLRFDESMKSGYEDWDFWLAAAGKGFRGRCLPDFGFEYRRRPESMVTGSHRDHQAIRGYMKAKHKGLLRVSNLLREEHLHSPRYAVYVRDLRKFVLFTDPTAEGVETEFEDLERMLWMGLSEPARANRPAFLVATTSGFLALLRRTRLAPWAFWHLEDRLGEPHVTVFHSQASTAENQFKYADLGTDTGGAHAKRPAMAMMGWHLVEACVRDSTTHWFDSILGANPSPRVGMTQLALPMHGGSPQGARENAIESLQWVVNRLHHSRYRDGAIGQWAWRNVSDARRLPASLVVRQLSELECPLLPRIARDGKRRDVAFILPLMTFGGVEKVAIAVARELKKKGWTPHLVISDYAEATIPPSVLGIFDSVSFLNEPPQGNPHTKYLGTAISNWSALSRNRPVQRAIGLLSGFDVVINAHSLNLNAVMGELKRRGVRTIMHQHVIDHTPAGVPCGHPYLAVAFEHAYDSIVCCSGAMRDWLFGMGVPYDKLIVVENAPSFPVSAEECDAALEERRQRRPDRPLRVLVLGRLDRQKGLHRVQALYSRVVERELPVEWRIVGSSVIIDESDAKLPAEICHPAVFAPAEIAEHLKWADVLLVLSSWEGLPLTVLEAMPFGVIPICTDVGAIREAVEHNDTGFVFPVETAVREAFDVLKQLQSDAALLLAMATRASASGRTRGWAHSVEPLLEYLEQAADADTGVPAGIDRKDRNQ